MFANPKSKIQAGCERNLHFSDGRTGTGDKKAAGAAEAAAQQVENLVAAAGACIASERRHWLKLLLSLQAAGAIAGAAVAVATSYNLLAGVGWGLGVGSVNFSVCLLSSKERVR